MGSVITHDSNQGIRVQDIPAFGASSRQNDALQAVFYADFNGTTCPTPDDNVACAFRALGAAMTKSVRDVAVMRNGTAAPSWRRGRSILWNVYTCRLALVCTTGCDLVLESGHGACGYVEVKGCAALEG